MQPSDTYPERDGFTLSPFFAELPAYVMTFHDEEGDLRVVTEKVELGRAMTCYLSPVDALIEVLQLNQMLGTQYGVMPAQLVPAERWRDADGRGLIANVHLGWPVQNGRLLLRPAGALGGYGRMMHHWAREPLRFEFDETVLAEVTRLHEWAGLFAWRETLEEVRAWKPERVARVVARALASIGVARGDVTQCRQVALFDPESGQWHFVPRAGSST
ncbi:hypothetical protein [Paraburkholderia lacunae]|uniref:Uncharacterized protein n=1 Tax=Paraburkholderia lacunae TaxID=2211104 RepID=A0A370NC81_9BURK|nr:hypothetical protein [Paraburkholderia lacunae]RDK03185.1 hypothetical protein DLM46_09900 [Paraburkholderia lacunae]